MWGNYSLSKKQKHQPGDLHTGHSATLQAHLLDSTCYGHLCCLTPCLPGQKAEGTGTRRQDKGPSCPPPFPQSTAADHWGTGLGPRPQLCYIPRPGPPSPDHPSLSILRETRWQPSTTGWLSRDRSPHSGSQGAITYQAFEGDNQFWPNYGLPWWSRV